MELPHHHGPGIQAPILKRFQSAEKFQKAADIFKCMDDPTRVRVFWLLCHCEECVVDLAALLDMSSSAVSHHLRSLKNSGLLVSRREGKEVFYRASDTPQSRLLHQMIEQILDIACPEAPVEHPNEQLELVHQIHGYLLEHLEERVTIDQLCRRYHIDPTTLKSLFKSAYGTSLAAHIKEHRMEHAAQLLRQTDMSIGQIAQAVGYESQSKFSAAFQSFFHVLPSQYRK